jgi:ACT domain-containing protein
MSRLITHADVAALADGGELILEPGAQLTPLASERAAARGIRLVQGDAAAAPPDAENIAREVTRQVVARLGVMDRDLVEKVVQEVLSATAAPPPAFAEATVPSSADYCAVYLEQERARNRRRAVITTTGKNRKGIVARLTAKIAEFSGDILDLSQTLVGDYFTMILVVDTGTLDTSFAEFKAAIEAAAQELGIHAMVMHEDIVTSLQRV